MKDIYVVVVSSDQHTAAVAYAEKYEDAFRKACNYLDQKSDDPNIRLKIDGVFDADVGVCNFTTENEYFGRSGFLVIDCVYADFFEHGKENANG